MLLQILGTLESLCANVATMRLQWDVDTDVRGDVIAFDGRSIARTPSTGEIEVVGRLSSNMALADMVIEVGGIWQIVGAATPFALEAITGNVRLGD
jgi:hypothetical protein